jgi:hypothetical protein
LSAAKKRNTLWIERNLVRRQKLLLSCQKCTTDVFSCSTGTRCMFAIVGGGGKKDTLWDQMQYGSAAKYNRLAVLKRALN